MPKKTTNKENNETKDVKETKPKETKKKKDEKEKKTTKKKDEKEKKTKTTTEKKTTKKKDEKEKKTTKAKTPAKKKTTKAKTTKKKDEKEKKTKTTEKKTTKAKEKKITKTPAKKKTTKTKEKKEAKVTKTKQNKAKTIREKSTKKQLPMWVILLLLLFITIIPISFLVFTSDFNNFIKLIKTICEHSGAYFIPLPLILVSVAFVVIGKYVFQQTLSFSINEELTERDNPAAGLYIAGFLLAIGIALSGALSGLGRAEALNSSTFLYILLSFIMILLLLSISGLIVDKFLLYKFSIVKEIIEDRNLGTGAVCFGAFVGTGFILMGTFLGESSGWGSLIFSIVVAFIIGQIIFLLGGYLFQKSTKYDFHYEIEEKDNVSAGIILGSFFIALGLVISVFVSNIDSTKKFNIDSVYKEQLLTQKISDEVKEKFKEHKIELTDKAKVITNIKEFKWTLVDKDKNYTIKQVTDDELTIYLNKTDGELIKQMLFICGISFIGMLLLLGIGMGAGKLIFPGASLDGEVQQKNPAVAMVIAIVYIVVAIITYTLFGT